MYLDEGGGGPPWRKELLHTRFGCLAHSTVVGLLLCRQIKVCFRFSECLKRYKKIVMLCVTRTALLKTFVPQAGW